MKNRKSYSRCPALLAVLTVCSTVLFLFSSCGSGNGKPSSVGSDDPADTYRGYLSEIRRLDHLTAKELAGHLKRWQTVKDSVFARLRRDTLGLPGSDACKVCEGIHDSLRIEFSRLALSGPRTYGELLMLKERLSPYAADEELRRAAETVRPFFASLDGHPACRDDRRQVLSTYRALLAESIRDGIHSRDDLTAYIAREDAVFRGFLTHLHELGSSDVADIACDTERCCSQVFLAAGRGEIAWRVAMLFLAMRTGRRLIQNAHTCIDDIRNRRVKTPQQACAYIWMLLQPYASMDGLCLALLSPQERERLDEIAAQTSAAFEALGSILQSTGDRQDELPGMLMEAFIHTL